MDCCRPHGQRKDLRKPWGGHVFAHAVTQGPQRSGVKLVWVAPLRALSADIADAARAMVKGMGLDWEVGTRTGDTSAKEKAKQKNALPDVLITTPESLHILIAQKGGAKRLASASMVVVDEWHELLGSKRGVQVELAVSWIRHSARQRGERMPVWGVSATLAHPEEALESLVGHREGTLVRANIAKEIHITSTMPQALCEIALGGSHWPSIVG